MSPTLTLNAPVAPTALAPVRPRDLAADYPACFDWVNPRPLKRHIHKDLARIDQPGAALPDAADGAQRQAAALQVQRQVKSALADYCSVLSALTCTTSPPVWSPNGKPVTPKRCCAGRSRQRAQRRPPSLHPTCPRRSANNRRLGSPVSGSCSARCSSCRSRSWSLAVRSKVQGDVAHGLDDAQDLAREAEQRRADHLNPIGLTVRPAVTMDHLDRPPARQDLGHRAGVLSTVAGRIAAMDGAVAGQSTDVLGRHARRLPCRLIHQQELVIGADDHDDVADPVDDRLEELLLSEERGTHLGDVGGIRQEHTAGCRGLAGRARTLELDGQVQVAPGLGRVFQADSNGRFLAVIQYAREAREQGAPVPGGEPSA